jgi:hypothetical protein
LGWGGLQGKEKKCEQIRVKMEVEGNMKFKGLNNTKSDENKFHFHNAASGVNND